MIVYSGRSLSAGAAAALALTLSAPAGAAPGALDPAFGAGGSVTTNFAGPDETGFATAIQGDGKIVVAGSSIGAGEQVALARYDTAGVLDPSFGGDGRVVTNFTAGNDFAFAIVIQADGRIVVAGAAGGSGGRIALARYDPAGALDPTFGGDGKVTTDFSPGQDLANALAVQADGKLVVAGRTDGSGGRFALARYDTSGALDPTFGGDGRVRTNFTRQEDRADAVRRPDGREDRRGRDDELHGDESPLRPRPLRHDRRSRHDLRRRRQGHDGHLARL